MGHGHGPGTEPVANTQRKVLEPEMTRWTGNFLVFVKYRAGRVASGVGSKVTHVVDFPSEMESH